MLRTLTIVALLSVLPRPATAQSLTLLEVSAGYAFVHDPKNQESLRKGWTASAGLTLTDSLAAVADVGGNYRTISAFGSDVRISVHAAMAGLRASGRIGRLTEFGQVLAGVVCGSGSSFGFSSTTCAFGLQPGMGFDWPLGDALAARAEMDIRFIHNQQAGNDAGHEYRFVAGLVYRFRR
jgi:hypothetical protein